MQHTILEVSGLRACEKDTSSEGISGSGGMRLGMVLSPCCRAEVSSGCMPLPVECRWRSLGGDNTAGTRAGACFFGG